MVLTETVTAVAGKALKVNVLVVQAVEKLPPDKVKGVPPLKGPFIGSIVFKRPPTVTRWGKKHNRRVPKQLHWRCKTVAFRLCCKGVETISRKRRCIEK
jgi:hypothetical protein